MKSIKLLFLVFLIFSPKLYCQENLNYLKAIDTLGIEKHSYDTTIVIEHGYKLHGKKVGLWSGIYPDKGNLVSCYINSGRESDSLDDDSGIFSLLNYENKTSLIFTDYDIKYTVRIDSVGRVQSKTYWNSDSAIITSYHKNGTISYYYYTDFKHSIENFYDENAVLTYSRTSMQCLSSNLNMVVNGQFISKGKYRNSLPHGIWKTYKNNKLVKIEKYFNGKILYKKVFY